MKYSAGTIKNIPPADHVQWQFVFGWFIILCLLFRAFVPAGFMPDMSAAGSKVFVICAGIDQKTIPDPSAPTTDHTSAPCIFTLTTPYLAGADFVPVLGILIFGLFLHTVYLHAARTCVPARYKAPRAPPPL